MSVFKARPGNLVMAEAVPFGQCWTYHTDHPMEKVLEPLYFLGVLSNFRTGDTLKVVRVTDNRVREYADMLVTYADIKERALSFLLVNGPVQVKDEKSAGVKSRYTVKRGFGCFEVRDSKGTVVYQAETKKEASDEVARLEQAA